MIDVSFQAVLFTGLGLVGLAVFWARERLGLSQVLLWSALRCLVQLTLMGGVLQVIFIRDSLVWTAPVLAIMVFAAFQTVRSRLRDTHAVRSTLPSSVDIAGVLITIGLASAVLAQVFFRESLGMGSASSSFFSARCLPIVGIVLGNSISALTLVLERFRHEASIQSHWIEARVLSGASAREALTPATHAALRAAVTPMLNALSAAGIVSLPGAMTGQLLAGQDPIQAAWVQFVLLGCLMMSSALGSSLLLSRWMARKIDPIRGVWSELL